MCQQGLLRVTLLSRNRNHLLIQTRIKQLTLNSIMKKIILIVFLLSIIIVGKILINHQHSSFASEKNIPAGVSGIENKYSSTADPCDASLWNHVYHSYRLQVIKSCLTVTGTVDVVRNEKDGDEHILLHLDAGQENLLNNKNIEAQKGDLVLEPICAKAVTQEDAIGPCSGYLNNVQIPNAGDKVSVTGAYVLDKEHGWMEIHPVTSITITGKGTVKVTDNNPIVGSTKTGIPIHQGSRGGLYHYSKSGNKVYEKKK